MVMTEEMVKVYMAIADFETTLANCAAATANLKQKLKLLAIASAKLGLPTDANLGDILKALKEYKEAEAAANKSSPKPSP